MFSGNERIASNYFEFIKIVKENILNILVSIAKYFSNILYFAIKAFI